MTMIYLGLEVCHLKQLLITSPPLIKSLEEKIDTVIKQNDIRLLKRRAGVYFLAMGEEAEADPKDILDAAFQLHAAVTEFREDLYGFNIVLAACGDQKPAVGEGLVAAALLELLEEEGVWIHNRDAGYFAHHAHLRQGDQYTRIIESKKAEPVYNVISQIPHIRRRIIRRLAQVFVRRFSSAGNPSVVFITGPADCAKREVTAESLRAVLGKERGFYLAIAAPPDRRRFHLLPLVASMKAADAEFLKRLPQYLHPVEKPVWKSYASLFSQLLEDRAVSGDRVEEDFFVIYNLFLAAYLRRMRECMLPGFLVFHDPHRLTVSVQERLKTLLSDLAVRFRIAVIVVSNRPQLPEMFKSLEKMRVTVKEFGVEDARRCFRALYPGVNVPRKALDHILRLSGGRYSALLHYIYYLRLSRKIVQEGEGFSWVDRRKLPLKVPAGRRSATLAIIRSLKEEARTVLYAGYCLGVFCTEPEIIDFLVSIGLNRVKAEEQLAHLRSMHLYRGVEKPHTAERLRRYLRRFSPQKTRYLEEQVRAFLEQRLDQFLPWRAAPCFRLLSWLGAGDLAAGRLAGVINYFLDTRLLPQAASFLSPEYSLKLPGLSEETNTRLQYILCACRVRYRLLCGDMDGADKEVTRSALSTESLVPQPWFARYYLELGRFHLCKEDAAKALPLLKKAVHYFQELSMTVPSSEAFLELGCGFLVKGNLKEALDYFSFATKLLKDVSAPFIHIRSLWFESVALYLTGNFSRILSNCDQAALVAGAHGFREAELLFGFLKSRVMFDLGFYDRAAHLLRDCLCQARLFGLNAARTILYAWLARSALYAGESDYALSLLRTLPETDETLFFRGEAYVISGEDKKAEKIFTKGLHLKPAPPVLFPEYHTWSSGFDLVEGRCLDLNTHGTPLFRLTRAFRAVLLCRAGKLEEGVADLHHLTITDKFAEADPHVYLFYFLYYSVLKTLEKKKTTLQEVGHSLTILNKSLKHLQERSTVIDEPRDRINYITRNYWNKLIFEEGKANKML